MLSASVLPLVVSLALYFVGTSGEVTVDVDATGKATQGDSTYKLMYFKTRGRAEVIRTLFAYANVEYEDVRFDNVDRSEFNAVREQGLLPYGQVPILEVDGEILAQSHAIERFLARRFDLMGSGDEFEVARIEGVCEHVADIYNSHSKIKYDKTIDADERAKRFAAFFAEYVPAKLELLEKIATANTKATSSPYLVGKRLTLADISVHALLDAYGEKVSGTVEKLKSIHAVHTLVGELPGVAKWELERPPA